MFVINGGVSGEVKEAPKQPEKDTEPTPTEKPREVYYKNCTAVREAGAAPLHAGDPGYSRALDRDGDGVACE
ncbi:excalibur calcium-binding domain-containing protein [Paenibacillus sp. M1]|uniref:Excalibur calcium-binding domain-containing protein n=1 Tax=Paenibacillus haidiansis TaxID=1574488 RepID=A0ABU7VS06_9BACL